MNPIAVAVLATVAAAVGSMRLWWLHVPRMESRYLLDYCRYTVGMPSYHLWPYRIEVVQHLSPTVLPDAVYGGRPLYMVLLWPLLGTVIVGLSGLIVAAMMSPGPNQQDRVIRGPRLVSRWQFNLRTLFKRKGAFYVEAE
jgi:hypothetical protein